MKTLFTKLGSGFMLFLKWLVWDEPTRLEVLEECFEIIAGELGHNLDRIRTAYDKGETFGNLDADLLDMIEVHMRLSLKFSISNRYDDTGITPEHTVKAVVDDILEHECGVDTSVAAA